MRRAKSASPARCAIYLRCSTDDQAHKDYSTIDTQREINTAHIGQCGGVFVNQYADEGKTGTDLKRPGYKDLLRDAEAGCFDVVVCTYMSRLARGEAHSVAEYQLKEAGVRVEYVKENFTDDMAGYINKQMTRLMDGMYPQMVSQWTRAKQEQMLKAGYYCGGCVPFGYRLEPVPLINAISRNGEAPKRLVPDPDAVPLVMETFERFVATRNATVALEYLRTVTNLSWTHTKATYLLKNRAYRGVARWGKNSNEAAHAPIVPEALWNAAQEIFAQGAQNRARRPKSQNVAAPHAYYLRGLVRCKHCGSAMTTADHVGRRAPVRYYECLRAIKQGDKSCPVQRVNANLLHGAVVGEIQRLAEHPWRVRTVLEEVARRVPSSEGMEAEAAQVTRRLRQVDKQIEATANAVSLAGASSRAVLPLVRKLETLEADRQTLQQEQQRLTVALAAAKVNRPSVADLHRLFARFAELFAAATEEEKAELLSLLVGEVEMETKEKGSLQILLNLRTPPRGIGFSSLVREDNGN